MSMERSCKNRVEPDDGSETHWSITILAALGFTAAPSVMIADTLFGPTLSMCLQICYV